MNLFTHRDLMAWLNQPFTTPPDPQDDLRPAWSSLDLDSMGHDLENTPLPVHNGIKSRHVSGGGIYLGQQ